MLVPDHSFGSNVVGSKKLKWSIQWTISSPLAHVEDVTSWVWRSRDVAEMQERRARGDVWINDQK